MTAMRMKKLPDGASSSCSGRYLSPSRLRNAVARAARSPAHDVGPGGGRGRGRGAGTVSGSGLGFTPIDLARSEQTTEFTVVGQLVDGRLQRTGEIFALLLDRHAHRPAVAHAGHGQRFDREARVAGQHRFQLRRLARSGRHLATQQGGAIECKSLLKAGHIVVLDDLDDLFRLYGDLEIRQGFPEGTLTYAETKMELDSQN